MHLGLYVCGVLLVISAITNACTYKTLVFRGASYTIGGTGDIVGLVSSTSTYNENNADARNIGYGGHYKSSEMEAWNTSTFSKIRLEVIKSGVEQMYFEFNATGTTKNSWIRRNKVTDSSVDNFDQLQYEYHWFFYIRIRRYTSGCYNQILLIDSPYDYHGCYNYSTSHIPEIRFVPDGKTSSKVVHADEIAIYFVKDELPEVKPVLDLPSRNPTWNIASVDDKNILSGLYVTEANYDMASFVVTGREIGCGAQLQIWLNDTLPVNDGVFYEMRVCMTNRYNDDICKHSFTVDVMICGNRRFYLLPKLTSDQYDIGTQSVAYCFVAVVAESDKDTHDKDTTREFVAAPIIIAVAGVGLLCFYIGVFWCFCKNVLKSHQVANDISLNDSNDAEKDKPSVAWSRKNVQLGGMQTHEETKTEQMMMNTTMKIKEKIKKKKSANNRLLETDCTLNIRQNNEINKFERGPTTEDGVVFVARTTMDKSCYEVTEKVETSRDTYSDINHTNTDRRNRRKRKENVISHESVNVKGGTEPYQMAEAEMKLAETKHRHVRPIQDKDKA